MNDRETLEWLLSLTTAKRNRVCKIVKDLTRITRGQISRIDALTIAKDVVEPHQFNDVRMAQAYSR